MKNILQRGNRKGSDRGRWSGLRVALVLAASVAVFLSCQPPSNDGFGGLTIQVAQTDARLIAPGIDMTTSSQVISGAGPGGAAFSQAITGSSLTLQGLTLGSWTISVDGQNAAGAPVTHGDASVTVAGGASQTVNVAVAPIAGSGALQLTVTWPAASVDIPSIQAQLIPGKGSPIDLIFSIPSPGNATYSNPAIKNGYYTLTVKLLDNGQLVMGAVDMIRIVKGQTTSGTVNFTSVNAGTGSVVVNITASLNNPVPVSITGQQAVLAPGTSTTVTASVPQGLGTATFVWYLNGVSRTIGPSYTFNDAGSPLSLGTYRCDVTAFISNGSRGGSASFTFTVASSPPPPAARTYSTSFPVAENPISENGNWTSGKTVGLDWYNVVTTPGLATGTDSPVAYSDPTAVLTGTWKPDQQVEATVYSVNQTQSYYQEVEIRLRSQISAHSITGYEINFRCLKNSNAYMQIVRWNGALGNFTYLSGYSGAQFGVTSGDVVRASMVGNLISVYINNVLMGTATDSTFAAGNPGIGFDYGCGPTYKDFGFTKVTAAEVSTP